MAYAAERASSSDDHAAADSPFLIGINVGESVSAFLHVELPDSRRFSANSPKSPKLGTMEISLDGKLLGIAILSSAEEEPSQPVFSAESIGRGRHCVEVRPHIGLIALDIIEVS